VADRGANKWTSTQMSAIWGLRESRGRVKKVKARPRGGKLELSMGKLGAAPFLL